MTETRYLNGKVWKRSLPVFQGPPPADAPGPKRLFLRQGELAHFYDGDEGMRYAAFVELRPCEIRGNHWHHKKEEQIYIISGAVTLVAQDRDSGSKVSIKLEAGDLAFIATGVAHAIKTAAAGHGIEFSQTRFDAADVQPFTVM